MKRNFHSIAIIFIASIFNTVFAQEHSGEGAEIQRNIIKLNVPALVFKNFSVQYERQMGRKTSLALNVRYRPVTKIPFEKAVQDFVDDSSIRVDLGKIGNLGITAEYRFYLGKKGNMTGFYIAPLLSYNNYKGNVPINYYDYVNNATIDKTATFTGSVNTFTAGFQLGAQWKLGENMYLDWWIAGPNYGISRGDFNYVGSLNDIERISLQYELEKIKQTIPVVSIEIPRNPDANGAVFKVKGPWGGIRAFGINIGYRF